MNKLQVPRKTRFGPTWSFILLLSLTCHKALSFCFHQLSHSLSKKKKIILKGLLSSQSWKSSHTFSSFRQLNPKDVSFGWVFEPLLFLASVIFSSFHLHIQTGTCVFIYTWKHMHTPTDLWVYTVNTFYDVFLWCFFPCIKMTVIEIFITCQNKVYKASDYNFWNTNQPFSWGPDHLEGQISWGKLAEQLKTCAEVFLGASIPWSVKQKKINVCMITRWLSSFPKHFVY